MRASMFLASQARLKSLTRRACRGAWAGGAWEVRTRRRPEEASWRHAATGVTDEAWANAAKHYDEEQLAALVSLIAEINAWNRLNVITRRPGGDYQPGQRG